MVADIALSLEADIVFLGIVAQMSNENPYICTSAVSDEYLYICISEGSNEYLYICVSEGLEPPLLSGMYR